MITALWIVLGLAAYVAVGLLSGRATYNILTWVYGGEAPGRGDITPRQGAVCAAFVWPLTWFYMAACAVFILASEGITRVGGLRLARRAFAWMTREETK